MNENEKREAIRQMLDKRYNGAVPVTDAMIDTVLDGLADTAYTEVYRDTADGPQCTTCDTVNGHTGDCPIGDGGNVNIDDSFTYLSDADAEQKWRDAYDAFHGEGPYALENQDI